MATPSVSETLLRPPRPQLVFRVGVLGHRPDRLTHADPGLLAERLHQILRAVKTEVERFGADRASLFDTRPPALRALSPLAEGVDRMFADQALQLSYELCCPMPFEQSEFERDFDPANKESLEPDSLERFRGILAAAERRTALVKFEMDGDPNDRPSAYGACGRVLLNQCDLLVVVWDGERRGKRGGTEETLALARERGVPTVWVDAHAPHPFQLLVGDLIPVFVAGTRQKPAAGDHLAELSKVVRRALDLPRVGTAQAEGLDSHPRGTAIADFSDERQRKWNPAPLWKAFRVVVGDSKWTLPSLKVEDYEAAVEWDWPRNPTTEHGRVVDRLRPFYAWSDRLAVIYGDLYRSAFLAAFAMAAIAVGMALLPLAFAWDVYEPHVSEAVFVATELVLILGILLIVWLGRRRKWHERFVDYRLAAELVRHLRISAPLGSTRPFPQTQAQLKNYGHPASTWMAWYVRAVERELGLPNVRLDADHLKSCAVELMAFVDGQREFHGKNAEQSHRLERRLHRAGLGLLVLTVVACVAHLFGGLGVIRPEPWVLGTLTFCAGFLPALGSALAGINNQGEFGRLSMRYDGMRQRLESFQADAEALGRELQNAEASTFIPGASRRVSALAGDVAQLVVNEVLDWRIVFLDRPLKEP